MALPMSPARRVFPLNDIYETQSPHGLHYLLLCGAFWEVTGFTKAKNRAIIDTSRLKKARKAKTGVLQEYRRIPGGRPVFVSLERFLA